MCVTKWVLDPQSRLRVKELRELCLYNQTVGKARYWEMIEARGRAINSMGKERGGYTLEGGLY